MKRLVLEKRGISPIISSLMLTAIVIALGITVWATTSGSSSIMKKDYFNEVTDSIYTIKERYYIENVGLDLTHNNFIIWVYNFGQVDINITTVQLSGTGKTSYFLPNRTIRVGEMVQINLSLNGFTYVAGTSMYVATTTLRGNKAYASTMLS